MAQDVVMEVLMQKMLNLRKFQINERKKLDEQVLKMSSYLCNQAEQGCESKLEVDLETKKDVQKCFEELELVHGAQALALLEINNIFKKLLASTENGEGLEQLLEELQIK